MQRRRYTQWAGNYPPGSPSDWLADGHVTCTVHCLNGRCSKRMVDVRLDPLPHDQPWSVVGWRFVCKACGAAGSVNIGMIGKKGTFHSSEAGRQARPDAASFVGGFAKRTVFRGVRFVRYGRKRGNCSTRMSRNAARHYSGRRRCAVTQSFGGWSAFKMVATDGNFIGSGRSQLRHWNLRGGLPLG